MLIIETVPLSIFERPAIIKYEIKEIKFMHLKRLEKMHIFDPFTTISQL
jgi:hypothetical protein